MFRDILFEPTPGHNGNEMMLGIYSTGFLDYNYKFTIYFLRVGKNCTALLHKTFVP